MSNSKKSTLGRRTFIKGAVGSAAAMLAQNSTAQTSGSGGDAGGSQGGEETVTATTTTHQQGRLASDYMVDIFRTLDIEYVTTNPGSSFQYLQESMVNYGGNRKPEVLTCCHEESAVAMGHGYFKVEGKPLLAMIHSTVGLQHATMAIYNAYCDRVPVYIILGNHLDAAMRGPGTLWYHSAQDPAAIVRDYTKWDDAPVSLTHFAESAVRAYKIAMTPPMGPVMVAADSMVQDQMIKAGEEVSIPRLTRVAPVTGDPGAVDEAAKLLAAAQNPVIIAGRYAQTDKGMAYLVELAETLQAAVVEIRDGKMKFPSRHPLKQTDSVVPEADVILSLEHEYLWGELNRNVNGTAHPRTRPDVKVITIHSTDLFKKSNYQDFQRYQSADIAIAAEAEATTPYLIEAIRRHIPAGRRRAIRSRGEKLAEASRREQQRNTELAALGWNDSPISSARLAAEVWDRIKRKDWALVSRIDNMDGWPWMLWEFTKPYQHIGASGGSGIGYNLPAAVGAALAHRKHGRLPVNIQTDGDFMFAPGVLWTAAHHRIPLLTVMVNNRAYHTETMILQTLANSRNRGIETARIGTTLDDPNINFARIAEGMGVYAEGPITNPNDLRGALSRAIAVVERGEPALVDVVVQPV